MTTARASRLTGRAALPAALLAVLCAAVGCPAPTNVDDLPTSAPAAGAPVAGIPKFARVSSVLYRGGQPGEGDYETLRRMGIRTIVTLRVLNLPNEERREHDFRVIHISFKHAHPETEDVVEFLSIVTDPANQPVFVHCREGVDRTGMMVAIYRMVVQGWSKDQAIDEMKRAGFNEWNVAIERYLKKLDVEALRTSLAEAGPST